MKCPKCDHKQRRMVGMKCRSCGYHFAFDPKFQIGITYSQFIDFIDFISDNGTYYYTLNQLNIPYHNSRAQFYEEFKKGCLGCLLMITMMLMLLPGGEIVVILIIAIVAVGFLLYLFFNLIISLVKFLYFSPSPFKPGGINEYVVHLQLSAHKLEKLIIRENLDPLSLHWKNLEYEYKIEKILIVERNILVDLLVLNQFHTKEQVLIIAENGYPSYLMPVLEQSLRQSPRLPIYLLHDSTHLGTNMAQRIQNSDLFAIGEHTIFDLGISPKDLHNLDLLKSLNLEKNGYQIPIDTFYYEYLATALANALTNNITIGTAFSQLDSVSQFSSQR